MVAKLGILQVRISTIPYFTIKFDMTLSPDLRSNTESNKYYYDYNFEESITANLMTFKNCF